jgi:hypothetical protein
MAYTRARYLFVFWHSRGCNGEIRDTSKRAHGFGGIPWNKLHRERETCARGPPNPLVGGYYTNLFAPGGRLDARAESGTAGLFLSLTLACTFIDSSVPTREVSIYIWTCGRMHAHLFTYLNSRTSLCMDTHTLAEYLVGRL